MSQDYQSNLLARYFSGNASPEEEKQLMSWIKADPRHEQEFNETRRIWEVAGNLREETIDFDTRKEWEQFRLLAGKLPKRRPRFVSRPMLMMAAGLAILIGLFFAFDLLLNKERLPEPAATAETAPAMVMQEIATRDSSGLFFLPDSSKAFLNKNSKLSYPSLFAANRSVTLSGEAFFEVRHDSLHPFVVHTSGTLVRVLGTSFNVRENADGEVFVGVLSGKVVFSSDKWPRDSTVVLKAGDSGTFNKAKASFSKAGNTDAVWKAGKKQNFIKRTISRIKHRLKKTK